MLLRHMSKGSLALEPARTPYAWAICVIPRPHQRSYRPKQWRQQVPARTLGARFKSSGKLRSPPTRQRPLTPINSDGQALGYVTSALQPALQILDAPTVVKETDVTKALLVCKREAEQLKRMKEDPSLVGGSNGSPDPSSPQAKESCPGKDLMFQEDEKSAPVNRNRPTTPTSATLDNEARQEISDAAFAIVKDPKVFITPAILRVYTEVQALLEKPQTLPEVFNLYANKPAPNPDTSPITFRPARPNSLAAAIPLSIANAALDAALHAQDMNLSLDIMEQSVCQPAFRRRKAFTYALAPAIGLTLAPVGFWQVASAIAEAQQTMPVSEARDYWFLGLTTWFGLLMGFGGLAVTTINRRIDRVSWEVGTLFHVRWAREEERLMLDRVANHWGFKDRRRRGEESGSEWEALKDYCGMRELVLDSPNLMDDME